MRQIASRRYYSAFAARFRKRGWDPSSRDFYRGASCLLRSTRGRQLFTICRDESVRSPNKRERGAILGSERAERMSPRLFETGSERTSDWTRPDPADSLRLESGERRTAAAAAAAAAAAVAAATVAAGRAHLVIW